MKLHILGIAGTFMGGVAALARELGHEVEGSDQAVYPPMSTQLDTLGIRYGIGYTGRHIAPDTAQVVIGNALSEPVLELRGIGDGAELVLRYAHANSPAQAVYRR